MCHHPLPPGHVTVLIEWLSFRNHDYDVIAYLEKLVLFLVSERETISLNSLIPFVVLVA